MLDHRRRRWSNIRPTLDQPLVFVGLLAQADGLAADGICPLCIPYPSPWIRSYPAQPVSQSCRQMTRPDLRIASRRSLTAGMFDPGSGPPPPTPPARRLESQTGNRQSGCDVLHMRRGKGLIKCASLDGAGDHKIGVRRWQAGSRGGSCRENRGAGVYQSP